MERSIHERPLPTIGPQYLIGFLDELIPGTEDMPFSGKLSDVAAYHVGREDHRVDMAEVEKIARARQPKLIIVHFPRDHVFDSVWRVLISIHTRG